MKSDEAELWRRYREDGDAEARRLLIERYMPLVRTHAEMLVGRFMANVMLDDLIACGYVGLIEAVQAFDPARGTRFSTFCKWRVKGAMIDRLRNGGLGASRAERIKRKRVREEYNRLSRGGRVPVDYEALAKEARVSVQEAIRYLQTGCIHLSFEDMSPMCEDEDVLSVADVIEDEKATTPQEAAEIKDMLDAALENLDEEERRVVEWHHRDGLSLREISKRILHSATYTSQLHRRALMKARRFIMEQMNLP